MRDSEGLTAEQWKLVVDNLDLTKIYKNYDIGLWKLMDAAKSFHKCRIKFRSWASMIIRRGIWNELRRKRREQADLFDVWYVVKENHFEEIISKCGNPELMRQIFMLSKTRVEVSQELGVCPTTINNRVNKCLEQIRESL